MGGMKIYLDDEMEQAFREAAMNQYGHRKGSLSMAAEQAIKQWMRQTPTPPAVERAPEKTETSIHLPNLNISQDELQEIEQKTSSIRAKQIMRDIT